MKQTIMNQNKSRVLLMKDNMLALYEYFDTIRPYLK